MLGRRNRPMRAAGQSARRLHGALRRSQASLGGNNNVRFTPESRHVQCNSACLLWAISGLTQRSKKDRYSMTSSAAISKPGGTVKPSAFAVLRLTTVSVIGRGHQNDSFRGWNISRDVASLNEQRDTVFDSNRRRMLG